MTDRWAAGCNSSERSGRSARYYEFTLSERREVTLYLQSSTDPYLYLRTGAQQRSGRAIEYDDDGGRGYDSRIRRTLEAGTYTIEATTFNPGTGDFTLTLFGTGDTAGSPSQLPAEETSSSSSQTPQAPAPSQPAPAPMPALRVADAQAEEGNPYNEGEMHFTVTLSPAANHEIAVSYTTRDGTASGDLYGLYGDYEEEYGRTSFAPGETRKTVRVRLIGDWHDEGPETFSLVLSNPQGARIADGEGTGTIINDDPIPAAWNARFGRTVADQVLDAVEARMGNEPVPGLDVTLASERLAWTTVANGSQLSGGASGRPACPVAEHQRRHRGLAHPERERPAGYLLLRPGLPHLRWWSVLLLGRRRRHPLRWTGRRVAPGRGGDHPDAGHRLELGTGAEHRGQTLHRRAAPLPQHRPGRLWGRRPVG